MKKINNKGFTVVELLVSISLTSVIVLFLIEILLILKDMYVTTGIKTKMLTKQSIITENLYDDILNMDLASVTKCFDDASELCLEFKDKEDNSKKLLVNREKNYIKWNGVRTNLLSGSTIGNINVSHERILVADPEETKDSIFTIDVPIYHTLLERENYGFTVVFQYNSTGPNMVSIVGANISDIVDAEKRVYLIGGGDVKFKGVEYIDPGFYYVDKDGEVTTCVYLTSSTGIKNEANYSGPGYYSVTYEAADASGKNKKVVSCEGDNKVVHVSGKVGDNVGERYYLTYTIYDMNNSKMSEVTRTVDVAEASHTFNLTKNVEQYSVLVDGTYEIEVWGASGGGSPLMKGKGGYASSTLTLSEGDVLYVTVGGAGTQGSLATGGYNGGGAAGESTDNIASSGGGCSEVKLNSNDRSALILVAGGGGGGGSRADTNYSCYGGSGGGEEGTVGACSSTSYVGGAGTQTVGGAPATYATSLLRPATKGLEKTGGQGATYMEQVEGSNVLYASGGGGGGYFGGGGGSRFGGGGGGSGYCKLNINRFGNSCTLYTGIETFIAPDGKSYETGHDGDGAVKITLKSVKITE